MKKKFVKILTIITLNVVVAVSMLNLVSCDKIVKEVASEVKGIVNESTSASETIESDDDYVEDENVVKEAREVVSPMEVLDVAGYRDTDSSTYIEVSFSKEIKDGFDGTSYIKIEPEVSFTVSKVEDKLMIRGDFNPKQNYIVKVLNGVSAIDGTKTLEDTTASVLFDQKKPKLTFSNEGIILPSVNEKKIYIRSMNVKKINVVVKKVYANNLTQFLQYFDFKGNGKIRKTYDEYYDEEQDMYVSNDTFEYVGDVIYDVDYDIENVLDTWVQTAVDLSDVIDNNGLYIFEAKFDKDGTTYKFQYDSWWYLRQNGEISKTILLTDIGIIAKKTDEGLNVNVLNIVENKLLSGTKVYLMSKNNQILEEKTTDADGMVNFADHKNSFYILADNGNSKSILLLKNALSTNGFAVDGAYVNSGVNAFIYTERGVYRPGDQVYVSIIARNSNEPLAKNQPITLTVYDPTGVKMIENDVIRNGKNGFYTYTFKTDTSARTGIWKLEAKIGDEIFSKDISIETVVPNRLKVNVNIPDEVKDFEHPTDWSISSTYLFGEPAKDLDFDATFEIKEEPVDFEKYKDYTFKTPTSYGFYRWKNYDGKLDKDGIGVLDKVNFEDLKFGPLNLLADVTGRVIDDGGRSVTSKKYVTLKKYDTYIGIENTDTYKRQGSKLDLKVISVTTDGETLVPNKELKYRIYGNDHYWWWDYADYNQYVRSFKSDKNTVLVKEGVIRTADVPVLIDDVVPDTENIYVEIEDETTGQKAGVNLQSSEWIDASITKKIETINLSADKKKYQVGDVAVINYKGANKSKAIITIEKAGKILNQYYRDVDKVDMTEEITITKEMTPNVYVYVTLLQDYNTKENDRPLRLYGVVPLNVEDEDTKVDLEITAPEEIRPNEKFTVKIHNTKQKQVDFTVAVVDEGLLDITTFKTPNPFEYFFKKLAAKLMLYDNYSEIIDRPYGAINQILKVGGDEALLDEMARRRRLKELGLEEADRFTPVSMYKGILTTDENGDASVDFDMPNYMGSVRIMVVAANGDSYGSAEKNMVVKAPLIVEPTLPRSIKIGDKMSIPVSIFALEENIGNVEVYYTFKEETQTKNLTMNKGDKEIIYFEEEIGDEVGSEELTVGVRSSVYNYEETVGMAVNSNNAATQVSETKELKGRQEVTFTQENKYVKGTVNSVLTISNTMMLGLDQRLKFLIKYPYGCAEQTTSSVFPQLFIDKLSTIKDYSKKEIVDNINAGIQRLKLFQLSDGSFSYWPGENATSDYATNYIGHFLINAKNNGYYMDSMYDNWLNYTMSRVRGTNINSDYDVDLKCYSLYLLALAGKQNVSEMNYMYENYIKTMSDTSKMYLAAAYKLSGEGATAIKISSDVTAESIKKKFDEINARDRYYYNYSYGSRLRELAVYLDCYYTIYEKRDDKAFNEILTAMRTKDWYSTQTTSYSLLALSNVVANNAGEEIKGKIDVDGVITEWSTKDQYRMTLYEDAKKIRVIPEVDLMVYVNYYWEGIPVGVEQKNYSEGFTLERNFYDDEGKKINENTLKSGDIFWLEVIAKPSNKEMGRLENIAVTQILPSGWEIENLRVTNSNAPEWVEKKISDTTVSYTDIRDDRVMWFFDCDGSKPYTFFVKLTAVTKGEFEFAGTTLEAMYDHNFRAFKKGEKVKVE